MKYEILKDGRLRLFITTPEQIILQALRKEHPHWGSHDCEVELMENLIANSELDWIGDGVIEGDLTSAPCLGSTRIGDRDVGYRQSELPVSRFGKVLVGG